MVRTDFSQQADPAYLSNGLIGIRPGPNPLASAPAAVGGYVYAHPVHRVECLAPAPYPLTTDIVAGGVSLLGHAERVTPRRQALDMAAGELLTELDFEPQPGVRIAISVVQFASRGTPSLVCQEITLASDHVIAVKLLPQIATQGVPGRLVAGLIPRGTRDVDAAVRVDSEGGLGQLGIALAVVADPAPAAEIGRGRKLKLRTIAAMVSKFYHPAPDLQAIRMASWGRMLGFERLRQQNRAEWDSLWKSRVRVDADSETQRALDAAFFYLHSSVHPSNQTGMPPFGLSQTEHYYGHSFWDTEILSFLPVLLASPEAAKSLLQFRVRGLEAARRAASLYGYRGAQFPWEAAQTDGAEATPTFADTGWSEQHIVPGVALAFWQYQIGAGDPDFLHAATWPVLKSVAGWIASRGQFTARGYEIRNIMGPNEGVNNIDNNAYVNAACATVLDAALRCAAKVGEAPPAAWKRIAAALVLPHDPHTGALMAYDGSSHDAFPDLSFLLPFEPALPPGSLERTYAGFKQRRREYMIGFATAAVAAGAAFQGDRARAADLFQQSWRPFWMPPFGMIKEAESQTYGCFLTDFGSMLQAVMIGFTGLRIQDGDWARYPATLPEGWKGIQVDRIWVRGEPKRIVAVQGRKPQILDA
jgi:trehalose/maltose hydrolase-like predicted phosphorylase